MDIVENGKSALLPKIDNIIKKGKYRPTSPFLINVPLLPLLCIYPLPSLKCQKDCTYFPVKLQENLILKPSSHPCTPSGSYFW